MFMRQPEKGEEKLPVSYRHARRAGSHRFATLYIGIMPNQLHRVGELGIGRAQTTNPKLWRSWFQSAGHSAIRLRNRSRQEENLLAAIGALQPVGLRLPAALVVGWLVGAALDRWLHTTWLYLAGILLGIAAGFIELIRTVVRDTK